MALGYYTTEEPHRLAGPLEGLAGNGSRPLIEHVFPFEELTQAY